jgi:hypothetical protein
LIRNPASDTLRKRAAEQTHDPAVHGKGLDRDERRHITPSTVPDHEARAGDVYCRKRVDAERLQFDLTVESIGEGVDDQFTEGSRSRSRPRNQGENDQRAADSSDDPAGGAQCHWTHPFKRHSIGSSCISAVYLPPLVGFGSGFLGSFSSRVAAL